MALRIRPYCGSVLSIVPAVKAIGQYHRWCGPAKNRGLP